jgi:hypothetical protein
MLGKTAEKKDATQGKEKAPPQLATLAWQLLASAVPALVTGLPACALSAQASSLVEQDAVRQSTYAATTPVSNHPS